MNESSSRTVPGHRMWRAKRARRRGRTVAIRARHRVLRWRRITVQTRDLRYGAEAVARHLEGRRAGLPLTDSRVHGWIPRAIAAMAGRHSGPWTPEEAPLPGFEPGFPD